MGFKQLTYLQRCKIQAFWKAGCTEQKIADEIGVHKSTISREFGRNMVWVHTRLGYWTYKADYAQTYAENRRKNKKYPIKFNDAVERFVREKLIEDWSSEQISGYAAKNCIFWISHERIYQYILKDKEQGGDLFKHLRHQHKKYRKRYGSPKREGPIKNKVMIDERPEIVDKKERIGDWEVDCIIGKNHKQAVVSIVERSSKFTILKKIKTKQAETVKKAIIESLEPIKKQVLTITSDNGSEFSKH